MDRTDCIYFEYKYNDEGGEKIKRPSCKIGKMRVANSCDEYCEWFELIGPEIPNPPTTPEPSSPLKSY